jgi:hypothetical protein
MELDDLRERWHDTIHDAGGLCPVCDRFGIVYRVGLNATMAKSLIWLSKANTDPHGWVDVPTTAPKVVLRSNQLPTTKHWGLIERRPNDDPKVKHSGMWRITDKGKQFVTNNLRVPKKMYIYNDVVEAWTPEDISISECFAEHFDYQDAMRRVWI